MRPTFARMERWAFAARERFGLIVARGYAILAEGVWKVLLEWTKEKRKGKRMWLVVVINISLWWLSLSRLPTTRLWVGQCNVAPV